jgi:hypothetical protein
MLGAMRLLVLFDTAISYVFSYLPFCQTAMKRIYKAGMLSDYDS